MKNLIDWLKSWFGFSRLSRQMYALSRKVEELQKKKHKSDVELNTRRARFQGIKEQFDEELRRTNQSLDRATGLNRKLSAALEAAHDELKTANDIIIPGLVAANKTFESTWDAQTARNTVETVMMRPQKEIE